MRALTIRQPWADAIAHGPKRVENRTRRTGYRGPLLIHAGLAYVPDAIHPADTADWPDTRGAVIAVANLLDCHEERRRRCCGRWAMPGMWHWRLSGVHALPRPVPAKGQLGLWTPPKDVLDAVGAQYPEMEVAG
ncbi:hypothetical protein ACIQGZ_17275 [Streptomyces sp. NPDC092296]|uniref:hypothetical protein n=1 Tax=Streptomyces sp. NPDC092296 TaxID=3366012 RepID=UPI003808B742